MLSRRLHWRHVSRKSNASNPKGLSRLRPSDDSRGPGFQSTLPARRSPIREIVVWKRKLQRGLPQNNLAHAVTHL